MKDCDEALSYQHLHSGVTWLEAPAHYDQGHPLKVQVGFCWALPLIRSPPPSVRISRLVRTGFGGAHGWVPVTDGDGSDLFGHWLPLLPISLHITPWDCHICRPIDPPKSPQLIGSPDWQSQTGRVWVTIFFPLARGIHRGRFGWALVSAALVARSPVCEHGPMRRPIIETYEDGPTSSHKGVLNGG